jgi:hypothetical protein
VADFFVDGSPPWIRLADLAYHDKREDVMVAVPLKHAKAEEIADDVKARLGAWAEVVPIKSDNSLFLRDRVGNLRRVVKDIQMLDQPSK